MDMHIPQDAGTKAFHIKVFRNVETGTLTAESDGLKGFAAWGQSLDELEQDIEAGVREMLTIQGFSVSGLNVERTGFLHPVTSPTKSLQDAGVQFVVTADLRAPL
ncbi:hypothetical protein M0638_27870 [Roseomonas sp. NAR14]|uniref:Uncharacterized protein n=1 Tax=Roseomonas acroporae TaxID=2937791 RepID=A0A9X2BYA3_9PROT|nr:hypothetical protein [Roseomonas acroporae]MCK8788171.1 hypothetical protein [Roseomonas acroporae]